MLRQNSGELSQGGGTEKLPQGSLIVAQSFVFVSRLLKSGGGGHMDLVSVQICACSY